MSGKRTNLKVVEAAKPDLPAAIELLAPYGYYDDDGNLKNWATGQVITDQAEIEHLHHRGAQYKPYEVANEQAG